MQTVVGLFAAILLCIALGAAGAADLGSDLIQLWAVLGALTLCSTLLLRVGSLDLSLGGAFVLSTALAAFSVDELGPLALLLAPFGSLLVLALSSLVVTVTTLSRATATFVLGLLSIQLALMYGTGTWQVWDPVYGLPLHSAPLVGTLWLDGAWLVLLVFFLIVALAVFFVFDKLSTTKSISRRETALAYLLAGTVGGICAGMMAVLGRGNHVAQHSLFWLISPLAAAVIGGATLDGHKAGIRTALVGSAVVAAIEFSCSVLRIDYLATTTTAMLLLMAAVFNRTQFSPWQLLRPRIRDTTGPSPQVIIGGFLSMMSWWRRSLVFWGIFAIVSFIYVAVGYATISFVPVEKAVVTEVEGVVWAWSASAGRQIAVQRRTQLSEGDVIAVGSGGSARLKFSDGSVARLAGDTHLRITLLRDRGDEGRLTHLYMNLGELLANVKKFTAPDTEFVVDTPTVAVGVRGTLFRVIVTPERTEVEVYEGEIELIEKRRRGLEALRMMRENRGGPERPRKTRIEAGMDAVVERALLMMRRATPDLETARDDALARLTLRTIDKVNAAWASPVFRGGIYILLISIPLTWAIGVFRTMREYDRVIGRRYGIRGEARARTPEDSASAMVLADMHYSAGLVDMAREEWRGVLEVDPDSQYGRRARELLEQTGGLGQNHSGNAV